MQKIKKIFQMKIEEWKASKLEYRSLEKNYDLAKNVDEEVCKKCGGICCMQCGCHFSPDDFEEISYEYLKKELEKGYISIDCEEGLRVHRLNDIYILRIRNKNSPVVDIGHHEGPCILWDEDKGCPFPYNERPTGAKLLIPEQEYKKLFYTVKKCEQMYPIKDCCYEWEPHQQVLKKLIRHFKYEYVKCSLK